MPFCFACEMLYKPLMDHQGFFDALDAVFAAHDLAREGAVAAAVSGGPDSMALAALLAAYLETRSGPALHALSVDHGLRPEAAAEARAAGAWLAKAYPAVRHEILVRDTDNLPPARVQERARADRYALMAAHCREAGIRFLFLAHHQDDQAETFLFRLAKGSGLDGLAGMAGSSARGDLVLLRPFLDMPKSALVEYCRTQDIPFTVDPSNDNLAFARVRLRRAQDVLAEEGLSARRLSATARRFARAREALDYYAEALWQESCLDAGGVRFSFAALRRAPAEVRLRVLQKALGQAAGAEKDYGPRLAVLEGIAEDLFADPAFKCATLAGCLIRLDREKGELAVIPENSCRLGQKV